ncbi:MAG: hypothetical protein KF820_01300 [Candidatus Paracaedibacteraceae bacterium]|nr:hypothetical protein [Candidatus Paracaedibacteraceae bacterium]
MFKILLPFFVFKIVLSSSVSNDLDKFSSRFADLTRDSFGGGDLAESHSMYALHDASGGQKSPFLDFVVQDRKESPEPDDYEESMLVLQEQMQREKLEQRPFDKGGLVNYIISELKINPVELDRSSGTIIDQINLLERLINIYLKTLIDDLTHVFGEKSGLSQPSLLKPELIKRRYGDAISMIRETLKLSISSSEDMLNLSFRFFVRSVAHILGDKCKVNPLDSHTEWQMKYDVFQRNISSIYSLFVAMSIDESKNKAMRENIEQIISPVLRAYYLDSCDYLETWYKTKRSTWSQGLQLLGARDSNTKKIFDSFDTSFRTLFPFVFDNSLTKKSIDDRRSELLLSFDSTEREFASSVSSVTSLLSWGAPNPPQETQSSLSVVVTAPQAQKASSGWGAWW